MSSAATTTLAGLLSGLALALVPRAWERWASRSKDKADGASVLSDGASSVTTAALALVQQHAEDARLFRESEAECRKELAALNHRCDRLEAQVAELRHRP